MLTETSVQLFTNLDVGKPAKSCGRRESACRFAALALEDHSRLLLVHPKRDQVVLTKRRLQVPGAPREPGGAAQLMRARVLQTAG